MLHNGLPVYRATIDDENLGMVAISLVSDPATECDFLKFSKEKEPMKFRVEDEEKRIVFGLVMGANQLIYRRNADFEFFITYSPETLRAMAEKYLKDGLQNRVDLQHDGDFKDGVNMVELFIKDTEKGINPKGFEEFDNGSLFASFHVTNDEVWQGVKDGTFKGFSLEGYFDVIEETEEAFTSREHEDISEHDIEDADAKDIEIILEMIQKLRDKIKK